MESSSYCRTCTRNAESFICNVFLLHVITFSHILKFITFNYVFMYIVKKIHVCNACNIVLLTVTQHCEYNKYSNCCRLTGQLFQTSKWKKTIFFWTVTLQCAFPSIVWIDTLPAAIRACVSNFTHWNKSIAIYNSFGEKQQHKKRGCFIFLFKICWWFGIFIYMENMIMESNFHKDTCNFIW